MLSKHVVACVLLICVCLPASLALPNWGRSGHAASGVVANALLTPAAQAAVLNLVPDVGGDLSRITNWADDTARDKYPWSASLHFANAPNGICNYDFTRDCPGSKCVDGAIHNYTARVINTALSPVDRAEALKFLVHFIGDIHQPLHVSFAGDKGGNNYVGTFLGQKDWKLHAVWDTAIINQRVKDTYGGLMQQWAKTLTDRVLTGDYASKVAGWKTCKTSTPDNTCSAEWANESITLSCSNAYRDLDGSWLKSGFNVGKPWYDHNLPVVEEQVVKAGVRMANVLNAIFP